MESTHGLRLHVIDGRYSLARLDPAATIPSWADGDGFVSISRSHDELSIFCATDRVPRDVRRVDGYVGIAVEGPLAPELVGVLASVAGPLAAATIPIVAVGTFDTDYVFVRETDLARGIDVLRAAGHTVG
ncbi:MAG TPA: ACT domain-containing protein [Gemmatimonadaceae bacterium]|nr:ACT domain-containing protein [Gemmatimonadaceae bacterium]